MGWISEKKNCGLRKHALHSLKFSECTFYTLLILWNSVTANTKKIYFILLLFKFKDFVFLFKIFVHVYGMCTHCLLLNVEKLIKFFIIMSYHNYLFIFNLFLEVCFRVLKHQFKRVKYWFKIEYTSIENVTKMYL